MLAEQTVLRRADDLTYQSLGENQDTVILCLIPVNYIPATTLRKNSSALDGSRSFTDIIELLAQQFEVPREQLQADMKSLAEQMIREGLIIPAKKAHA